MAAKLRDVVAEMKAVLAAGDRYGEKERSDRILELAGGFLTRALGGEARNGQTAILMLDKDASHLSFAYPEHLARGNVLPVDQKSFAGQVVLGRTVLLENNVTQEPHKDYFERIPDPSGTVRTIEKMIASPLYGDGGRVIGVVEVSRAGSAGAGPGANFTPRDVENLEKSCRVFAPFIARTWSRARAW